MISVIAVQIVSVQCNVWISYTMHLKLQWCNCMWTLRSILWI